MPPLHPILVNFTAALFPVSLLFDVAGRVLKRHAFNVTAWWTLAFGAVVTPFTAVAGWLWFRQMVDLNYPEMSIHKWLGTGLAACFLLVAVWRGRTHTKGRAPGTSYLIFLGILVTLLTVQGHLGGQMSFENVDPGRVAHEHRASSPREAPSAGSDLKLKPGWHDHVDVMD